MSKIHAVCLMWCFQPVLSSVESNGHLLKVETVKHQLKVKIFPSTDDSCQNVLTHIADEENDEQDKDVAPHTFG